MSSLNNSPIVIVGAGPSGLLLARYLQLYHLPCVIYEKEPSADSRAQGGTLDLHDDTGLRALRVTGLIDEARGMMRSAGEALKIVDMGGKVYMDENTDGPAPEQSGGKITGRPEIDRTDLRNLLIRSLEPDTIKWDHSLTSVKALTTSLYELQFKDKPTITTPYLVGADGTFSRIRPLLHDTLPHYSGVTMYDMQIPPTSMTPSLQKTVGQGSAMIFGDHKALMPQMNSGGKCKVYAALQCDEKWSDEHIPPEKGKLDWVEKLFEDWSPEFREVIRACDEESVVVRRIWQFDPESKWESEMTGVTIMGDAAHVMSPFAGEGVNQALADALDLGKTLVSVFAPPQTAKPFPLTLLPISLSSPPTPNPSYIAPSPQVLRAALRAYEKKMMSRAREYMRESKYNLGIAFGDDAARSFRNRFYWMFAEVIGWGVLCSPWWALRSFWSNEE